MYETKRPDFTERDAESLLALIQAPEFSVSLRENRDYTDYAKVLLKKFSISMKTENVERLGRFIARCVRANKKNAKMLSEAADVIYRRKVSLQKTQDAMGVRVQTMKKNVVAEENKFVRGDSFEELNPEAQAFRNRVKLIGMRSFKTAWFDAVKYRPDIIFTDDERIRSRIVSYYNRPVFSVDKSMFNFMKRNFNTFENGFYEYLEYLFYQIESQRGRVEPGHVADRTVFLVTTAQDTNDIDPHNNLLAINTNGHERPTYKGLPEFLTPSDKKEDSESNPKTDIQKVYDIASYRKKQMPPAQTPLAQTGMKNT